MLLEIREKAQGWFAWIIVILITIPFALWGIQSYLGVGKEPVVASVNGDEITQRQVDEEARHLREQLRQRLGKAYRPEMFTDKALRKEVVEQLIEKVLLRQTAREWKLRVGDDQLRQYIRSLPYFQKNGRFDIQAYNIAVRNQGMSQRGFEESVRQDLVMDQLKRGVAVSAIATDNEINEWLRLRDQRRKVAWLRVSGSKLVGDYKPSDEEIKSYYEEHKKRWLIPERVKVAYILLDPETVSAGVKVTEEALRDYWREHQGEFKVPEERRVRHILVAVPQNADDEAVAKARNKAEAFYKRLKKGESFEKLAREASDDPGSKEKGGDLGWISPGIMPEAFEKAAYALKKGEISQPVRTPFGFHIILVDGIRNGGKGDFEKLRGQIEAAYRRQQAEREIFDKSEKLADLTYENPDELTTAAEALGVKVRESDWFDRRGGKGPLASPKVVAAAFSEDVLGEGHNSELIELDEDRVLVLRVVDHEEERIPPLDKIKSQVRQAVVRAKAAELAAREGEKLANRVESGETTLEKIAKEKGWKFGQTDFIGRNDTHLPPEVVAKAFHLPRPADGKPSVAAVSLAMGDEAVLVVSAVKDGDPGKLGDKERKQVAQALAGRKGAAQFRLLVRYLKSKAKIERK